MQDLFDFRTEFCNMRCMDSKRLQPILDWNMTEQEGRAYLLALHWEDMTREMFPKEKGLSRLPSSGDPRKSTIFRFCWKLARETRGLLRPEEYKLYIKANLTMIKVKNLHLSPNVLCGDGAWIRWRIWKRLYDQKLLEKSGQVDKKLNVEVPPAVIKKLETTKRFIFEKCYGEPSFEKLQSFYDNKSLHLWVGTRIAHLYLLLSPWVKKIASLKLLEKEMFFDAKVYDEQINENVRIYFRQEFSYEFEEKS